MDQEEVVVEVHVAPEIVVVVDDSKMDVADSSKMLVDAEAVAENEIVTACSKKYLWKDCMNSFRAR